MGRETGSWRLRKTSSNLCRMKKQNRDQDTGYQTRLETDMRHSRLDCHLLFLPSNLCATAELNVREGRIAPDV